MSGNPAAGPGSLRTLQSERTHIARHGGTILVGQLAVMFYAVADSVIAGRYAPEALAAFSVATSIYASVFVAMMGVMQALMPIYAEHFGAKRLAEIGKAWRQAYYLLLGLSLAGAVLLLFPHWLLTLAKVPPEMRTDVLHYLQVQALALPLSLLFRAFATLSQAMAKPSVVMWIQMASLPAKVLCSVWFVFGGYGIEPMGAVGCAWGSVVVFSAMCVAALWMLSRHPNYAAAQAWKRPEPPDWAKLKELLRMGLPSGGAMFFEVTSFTLMAVLIARLGVNASAAHQVCVNVASVIFMVPLSLSIASGARVSYWIGAGDPAFAQTLARKAVGYVLMANALLSCCLLLLAPALVRAYTPDAAIQALATTLLYWTACFTLFDGLQTICVFLLRCYRVTVLPFVIYASVLWGMGLGGGMWLTYWGGAGIQAWQSPSGFWAAAVLAIALTGLAFWGLLVWTLKRQGSADAPQAIAA